MDVQKSPKPLKMLDSECPFYQSVSGGCDNKIIDFFIRSVYELFDLLNMEPAYDSVLKKICKCCKIVFIFAAAVAGGMKADVLYEGRG